MVGNRLGVGFQTLLNEWRNIIFKKGPIVMQSAFFLPKSVFLLRFS